MKRKTAEEMLAGVEAELAGVIALYDQLVEQSDKLAGAMQYREDYVLGKVMPNRAAMRRDVVRIVDWFDGEREHVMQHLDEIEANRVKLREREELLASLNLTEEQKALLFEE